MVEVPPGGSGRKALVTISKLRERAERPPACRRCSGRSWWNGWRVVFPTVAAAVAGLVERWELPVPRAKCSSCKHGFTCYPPGIYPRRQYQLDVVAAVAAAVALGAQPLARAAGAAHASATSARRWTAWVASLSRPRELLAVAARLDPDAPAGAGLSIHPAGEARRSCAARVLAALEHVGAALVRRGLALAARTGLGRVLGWQHEAHGDVYGLVAGVRHLSPAMALGGKEAAG